MPTCSLLFFDPLALSSKAHLNLRLTIARLPWPLHPTSKDLKCWGLRFGWCNLFYAFPSPNSPPVPSLSRPSPHVAVPSHAAGRGAAGYLNCAEPLPFIAGTCARDPDALFPSVAVRPFIAFDQVARDLVDIPSILEQKSPLPLAPGSHVVLGALFCCRTRCLGRLRKSARGVRSMVAFARARSMPSNSSTSDSGDSAASLISITSEPAGIGALARSPFTLAKCWLTPFNASRRRSGRERAAITRVQRTYLLGHHGAVAPTDFRARRADANELCEQC